MELGNSIGVKLVSPAIIKIPIFELFTLAHVCIMSEKRTSIFCCFVSFNLTNTKIHLIECKGWNAKSNKNKSVLDTKNKTHLFSKSFHLFLVAIYMSCNWCQISYIVVNISDWTHAIEKLFYLEVNGSEN